MQLESACRIAQLEPTKPYQPQQPSPHSRSTHARPALQLASAATHKLTAASVLVPTVLRMANVSANVQWAATI